VRIKDTARTQPHTLNPYVAPVIDGINITSQVSRSRHTGESQRYAMACRYPVFRQLLWMPRYIGA
jgi:hypothetical protein